MPEASPRCCNELTSDGNTLHLDRPTVTGKTTGENIADAEVQDHEVILPRSNAVLADRGLAVLFGNLAPEGSVVKTGAVDAGDAPAQRPGTDLRESG